LHPILDFAGDARVRIWGMRRAIKIDLTEADRRSLTAS
jgi:hypothetical protein